MKLSTSIVIPTYNGLPLLKKYLPSIVAHAHGSQIIVVDDASTDHTVKWLADTYPQIEVVKNRTNLGFALAVNAGFAAAQTDLVLLLNNDVEINAETLPKLRDNFKDNPKLFAVGAKEILPDGGKRGRSTGEYRRGLLIHSAVKELTLGPTLWVFGASGMFRRNLWHKLEGLDKLYFPAYWEDIDVSYRAWKAGYQCLFDPKATLLHQGESTMNRELGWKKQVFGFKNQLLFFWKNVSDWPLLGKHLFWMPYHLVVTSWRTRGAFTYGLYLALLQLFQITDQISAVKYKRTDQQVIALCG